MTATADRVEPAALSLRDPAVDAVRGLAILLMVLDHVWILGMQDGSMDPVRWLTRLAMPLFFLLGGHLFHRLSWRHAGIAAAGLLLPYVVPWIDSPNVLVHYVVGCLLLALLDRTGLPAWPVVVVGLTLAANGILWKPDLSYGPVQLLGLMALGRMLPRSAFAWGGRLPVFLEVLGRFPLRWYVGHLIALQLVGAVAAVLL